MSLTIFKDLPFTLWLSYFSYVRNFSFIIHFFTSVLLQPISGTLCYSLHHMFKAAGKRWEQTCPSVIILGVQRREELHPQQQQEASLCLHLPASASASMKCLYLGISQWKLALWFIPFSFLIMGCRPAVCLSADRWTTALISDWGRGGKE